METQSKKTRQSRYIRPDNKEIGRLVLQPRDIEIVKTVYDYRFIRTDQLIALTDGDETSIRKRLRKLWEHRYLERSFLPVMPGKEPDTRRAIYSLDYQGANLLAKNNGIDHRHLKHVIRHNKPGHVYIEHQLMASQFRTVLTLALEKTNQAEILFWRQDKEIRDYVEVKDPRGNTQRLPIAPDGFFCLEDTGGKMYWFLEVDRYTMDHKRWLNKMRAYFYWWEKKGHTEKSGIQHFRVLTVCPSAAKRDARLETTKKVKVANINGKKILKFLLFWKNKNVKKKIKKTLHLIKAIVILIIIDDVLSMK